MTTDTRFKRFKTGVGKLTRSEALGELRVPLPCLSRNWVPDGLDATEHRAALAAREQAIGQVVDAYEWFGRDHRQAALADPVRRAALQRRYWAGESLHAVVDQEPKDEACRRLDEAWAAVDEADRRIAAVVREVAGRWAVQAPADQRQALYGGLWRQIDDGSLEFELGSLDGSAAALRQRLDPKELLRRATAGVVW